MVEDIKELSIKELINYSKYMAGISNPQINSFNNKIICTVYKFVGEEVKMLIKYIKESTLKIIKTVSEKRLFFKKRAK